MEEKEMQDSSAVAGEHKEVKRGSRFRPSRLLDAFALWICSFFAEGFFGTILTAYSREEEAIRRAIQKKRRQRSVHRQQIFTNHRVARLAERVFITKILKRLRYTLLKCPFSYYANAIILYALVSLLSNLLVLFFTDTPTLNTGLVLTTYAIDTIRTFVHEGIFWVDILLLVLFSLFCFPIRSRSIHDVKMGSVILSTFFERVLGTKGELTEELRNRNSDLRNGVLYNRLLHSVLILLGIGCGVLSAFISPFWILLVLAVLLLGATVIGTPEAGLILTVFLLPFFSLFGQYSALYSGGKSFESLSEVAASIGLPTLILAACVLLTAVSFFIKVLRKKRLFHFKLIDAAVLLVAAVVAVYGFLPNPSAGSLIETLLFITFMTIYFLTSNLLRNEAWLARVLRALQFSVFLSLTAGIYVYFFGVPSLGWFPTDNLPGEYGNIAALFGGEQFLGAYLVLMLPLSLGSVFSSRSVWSKILGAMSLPEIAFVAFLLPSRLALLTCILGGVIFALFCTYKTLYVVPLTAMFAGVTYQLFPNGIDLLSFLKTLFWNTFSAPIRLWDRFFVESSDLSLLGVGYGFLRFLEHVSENGGYQDAGFLMRTVFGFGIPGILLLSVFLLLFVQMCLEELRLSRGSHLRPAVAGCFTAVLMLLAYGVCMPIFSDVRMMFFFWLAIGLATAYKRVCSERRNDRSLMRQQPMTEKNADVIVY